MRGFLHCGKKMSIVQETVRCRAHCLFILIKKYAFHAETQAQIGWIFSTDHERKAKNRH